MTPVSVKLDWLTLHISWFLPYTLPNKLKIVRSGNVGIGTTSPKNKFGIWFYLYYICGNKKTQNENQRTRQRGSVVLH